MKLAIGASGPTISAFRVSRLAFHASLRAVIECGEHHRRVFDLVRPGVDFAALRRERESTGNVFAVTTEDLYADVVPCLKRCAKPELRSASRGITPSKRNTRSAHSACRPISSRRPYPGVSKNRTHAFRAHDCRIERARSVADHLRRRSVRQRCRTGAAGRHGFGVFAARPVGTDPVALGTVFDPDPRHRRSFFTTGCVARDPSTHRPPRASFHIRCFPTSRRNRLPARSPHRGSR